MPIKVACPCGAAFAAPDQYAGRTVKCPKCSQPLAIPNPAAAAPAPAAGGLGDLLDEAGIGSHSGPRCPKCNATMPPNAVICVECGFHVQTGAVVTSNVKRRSGDGHSDAAETVMARAAQELAKAPSVETEQNSMGVLAGYLLSFGLLILAVVTIGLAYLGFTKIEASGNSQYYAGIVMTVVGCLMYTVAHIVLLVHNFKSGTVHGILSFFIPLYAPIYGALSGHGFWASLWFMGSFFSNVGMGMVFYFSGGSEGATSMLLLSPAPVLAWGSPAELARHFLTA